MDCNMSGFTISQSLFKLMSIKSVMPSNYLILCHPLLFLPSILPSIRVFSNEYQFFASGGRSIGASALASVLPVNIQDWFPLGWTGWISLLSKGLSRAFSNTTVQKPQFFSAQLSSQFNSHIHTWLLEKPVLNARTFVSKVMFLLFNTLSRFVIAFLPRSKRLLISWLQSLSKVILEPKSVTVSIVSPSICHEVMGPDAMILVFRRFSFKPAFFQSPFALIKRVFISSLISAIRVVSLMFLPAI